jgi:hypothetical protein
VNRLRNLVISMLALAGVEFVRIGLIGFAPMFASGFEFTMTAFAVAWLADGDGVAAQEGEEGK